LKIRNYLIKTLLPAILGITLGACAHQISNEDWSQESATGLIKTSGDSPVFQVGQTRYQGRIIGKQGVREFLGIPFAQPPIGALRWSAPEPVKETEGVVMATKFGPACMQGPHMGNWYKGVIESFGGDPTSFLIPQFSEDCLYLNIWSPAPKSRPAAASSESPVFVFIHGGSNKGGWSYEPNYLGEQLAARGAVVVTIGYRLGVFGFFAHPDLEQLNFALLDQIAALKWIQENISTIGGDPENVTVAGESAGASNIAFLMASPLAEGLFDRVIHQSGGWAVSKTYDRTKSEQLSLELAQSVLPQTGENGIEQLRLVSSDALLAAANEVYKSHYFDPVIDGHSVTQALGNALDNGQFAKVDVLIGTNLNESLMYLDAQETIDNWVADNITDRFPELSKDAITERLTQTADPRSQLDKLATAYNYTCSSLALAEANVKNGGTSWFYQFTKVRDGELANKMGAYHGAELPYVFNTHDIWLPTSQQDRELTDSLMQYWLNFAETGNPNSTTIIEWPTYMQAGDAVQYLGVDIKAQPYLSNTLCDLFAY
jgi:para-nitrobenzyl esterase